MFELELKAIKEMRAAAKSLNRKADLLERQVNEANAPRQAKTLFPEILKTITQKGIMNESEKDILFSYFGLDGIPKTLNQLGDKYKMPREHISSILSKILNRLTKTDVPEKINNFLANTERTDENKDALDNLRQLRNNLTWTVK